MADSLGPTPTVFKVHGTPLLLEGNTHTLLAEAPGLWAHIKVYARGGENGVHSHPDEDHLFFVLAGRATFVDPDDRETVVGPYEGIMLPRGTAYAFRSSADENLVLLRVGAPRDTALVAGDVEIAPGLGIPVTVTARMHVDGTLATGLDASNKTGARPGIPDPGRTLEVPAVPSGQ
jgi:mannose-6-phosphate isomerase-like protein (cupin superfamily)